MKAFSDYRIDVRGTAAGEVDTTCPECSAQRKKKGARCLSVNVDKGTWLCHHCGWSGGLGEGDTRVKPGWKAPRYRRPETKLVEFSAEDRAPEWFAGRGIPREVLDRNRVTATRIYMPQVEDHVKAIAFPYYRGDELVNVKYRDKDKNFRMEAGAERILYGLNDIEPELCVIVEGEVDKLSVEVAGIRSCVSVPDGAPSETAKNYASKFEFLESDEDRISAVKEWVIAVDGDAPGRRLEEELARRLGREKCRRVSWPEGVKDANDLLRHSGPDALREAIEKAEPFPIEGVLELTDFERDIDALYEHGHKRGLETGWREVDRLYTICPGQVTVVTGIPGSGKSNWVDALCVNLACFHGWRFAIFSPENMPIPDHAARLCEKYTSQPFFEGPTARMTRQTLEDAKAWVHEHFWWTMPDSEDDWTLDKILDAAQALVFRKGINGLVIDPWNELEHLRPKEMTQTEYIGRELRRIRQFARRAQIHIWVVAHPAKLYRSKDTGQYPVPSLYDVSDSANWRNKPDCGLVVWRDFKNDQEPVAIHVQKIRFRHVGKVGIAKLEYIKPTATYADLPFMDYRHED